MAIRNKLQVVGLINDVSFQIAKCCAEVIDFAELNINITALS